MSVLSKGLPYLKPVVVGAGMGAVSGALVAPKGQERSWATSGAALGGLSSGPAQVLLRRLLNRKTTIPRLVKAELPHQSTKEIFKWTGIGTAASAGITAATGGYKNTGKKSKPWGQAADTGIDVGEILLRTFARA